MTQEFAGTVYQGTGTFYFLSRETVVISGNSGTTPLTSMTFNLNGSTNVNDISNIRLFYSGSSTTVTGTTPLFGGAVVDPTGTVTFTGTQALPPGNNIFTLAIQVRNGATPGNIIDSDFTALTVGGTARTPSPMSLGNVLTIGAPPVNDNIASREGVYSGRLQRQPVQRRRVAPRRVRRSRAASSAVPSTTPATASGTATRRA